MKVNNVSTLIDATKAMIATHEIICNIAPESKSNPDEYACACMVAKMLDSAITVSIEILEHNDVKVINGDFFAKVDTINVAPVGNDDAGDKGKELENNEE